VVANILRKKDNLVKLVGTSASIVTIISAQWLLIADLRQSTWTVQTVFGSGIIAISTWCYHYYKQQPPPSRKYEAALSSLDSYRDGEDVADLSDEGLGQPPCPPSDNDVLQPTFSRVALSVLLVDVLAFFTALYGPRSI
jgi:hypothetical protein